jgi:hypothetical protein
MKRRNGLEDDDSSKKSRYIKESFIQNYLCVVIINEKHVLKETQMIWVWRVFSYNLDDKMQVVDLTPVMERDTPICMMFSSIVFTMNIVFQKVQIELENQF